MMRVAQRLLDRAQKRSSSPASGEAKGDGDPSAGPASDALVAPDAAPVTPTDDARGSGNDAVAQEASPATTAGASAAVAPAKLSVDSVGSSNSSDPSGCAGALLSPRSRHTDRGPPRTPELGEESHVISDPAALAAIASSFPARYRDSDLRLVYSTFRDGASIRTFFDSCAKCSGPILLTVRDAGGAVFGTFTTDPKWKLKKKYYGSGESFCFTLKPEVAVYVWSHKNKFFQLATPESIAFGGGGAFALYLGDMFERGTSGPCETYDSPMLSSSELFEVTVFEAWELVGRHN